MKVAPILGLGEGSVHRAPVVYCDDVAQSHRTCQVGLAANLSSQGSAAGHGRLLGQAAKVQLRASLNR